jgi:PAS domain S-box-containing protein
MHALLKRQLKHLGLSEDTLPPDPAAWRALLARVDAAYAQADQDRYTLERSLDISSNEMQELYADLERSSETALAQSVATLRATVEASEDAVLAIDERRDIVLFNRRYLELWSITAEQIASSPSDEVRRLAVARCKDPTGFRALIDRLYDGQVDSSHDEVELVDGTILECSSRAVLMPSGTALGRVWFMRDVTQARRAAAEHEALRREVDQFKLEMTSLVVHDLKNVMFIISANVDTAIEIGDRTDADQQEMLGDARDAAARAIRLIANLMDVARLEASAMKLDIAAVDPAKLCESASKHRVSQLRSRGIALAVDAGGVPAIAADFEIVQRVIDNVLDNAVRYTPSGGMIGVAATEVADGRIQIQIGNTGRPIPVEDRTRIFEKYGQAQKSDHSRMNSGLGLYFCRLAIEAHGGRMWVEERPDFPTTFVIELPIATAASHVPGVITTRLPAASRENYPRDSWPPPGSLPL